MAKSLGEALLSIFKKETNLMDLEFIGIIPGYIPLKLIMSLA